MKLGLSTLHNIRWHCHQTYNLHTECA